ncbi:hypothetical protein EJD97_024495, partial [Solanum chilense]
MVASIPIQLKNLQVFTVIRVIFQLTEEIPCISAVVVALLSEPKPRIDYVLKAVGGSLTALPGLSDMIDDTVNTIVTDIDLELKPQGKLTVTIVKANGLKNHEMIGKSDPYAVVHIRPLFKVKTKTIDNNLNPVWDQTFELIAEDKETQSLFIEVFDKDNIGQDQRMGVAKLPLNELVADAAKEIELRLLPKLDMCRYGGKWHWSRRGARWNGTRCRCRHSWKWLWSCWQWPKQSWKIYGKDIHWQFKEEWFLYS